MTFCNDCDCELRSSIAAARARNRGNFITVNRTESYRPVNFVGVREDAPLGRDPAAPDAPQRFVVENLERVAQSRSCKRMNNLSFRDTFLAPVRFVFQLEIESRKGISSSRPVF